MIPSNQNNFARSETKYRVSPSVRAELVASMNAHLEAGGAVYSAPPFNIESPAATRVSSLYLDTPTMSIISRSLDKPLYKEKLRLRIYGEGPVETVFFELKKKFKGIVYKRRIGLPASAFNAELARCISASLQTGARHVNFCYFDVARAAAEAGLVDYLPTQIARELNAALARHDILEPSILTVCDRVSMGAAAPSTAVTQSDTSEAKSKTDDIRVTLDSNLRYLDLRSKEPGLEFRASTVRGVHATQSSPLDWGLDYLRELSEINIIPPNESIVEIKTAKPYPKWLRDVLDETRTFPQSFSKYGTAATMASQTLAHDKQTR